MGDGDQQRRFSALWREHQAMAWRVALVYARTEEDRRDLVQDIGTQLWRSFAGFDASRAKFSTWMYRVALNVAISRLRQRACAGGDRVEPLQPHHLETVAGGQPIVEQDERLQWLRAFIDRLGALDRALILLYLEDRDHTEMADILGISKSNVGTRIGRIKQKLRDQAAIHPLSGGA